MNDPTIAELENAVQEAARKYAEENINNPGPAEHALIHGAMLQGWQLGVRQAIEYMKAHGIQV